MESAGRPVAVVTGASRGIGRVVAGRLASSHLVVAIGRDRSLLEELSAQTGAVALVLDVSDPAAVSAVFADIEALHGGPSLLVNNAGISGPPGSTAEVDPTAWWRVFEVNVLGTFLCTRAVLPAMISRGSGRIVNVASNAAFYPVFDDDDRALGAAYMASKAAVIRFTEALAGETLAAGMAAFAISPGTVKTDMTATAFADDWDDADLWASPELTADLVELIASGALDVLSGRYLHARYDDPLLLVEQAAEIIAADTHVLRVRDT
jgi:3-oxoacyl-[acyl-carrier protein] reductase